MNTKATHVIRGGDGQTLDTAPSQQEAETKAKEANQKLVESGDQPTAVVRPLLNG